MICNPRISVRQFQGWVIKSYPCKKLQWPWYLPQGYLTIMRQNQWIQSMHENLCWSYCCVPVWSFGVKWSSLTNQIDVRNPHAANSVLELSLCNRLSLSDWIKHIVHENQCHIHEMIDLPRGSQFKKFQGSLGARSQLLKHPLSPGVKSLPSLRFIWGPHTFH